MEKKTYKKAYINVVEIRGDILTVSGGFTMSGDAPEEAEVANGYNCYDSAEEL